MIRHAMSIMGKETVYWERNPSGARTLVLLHGFRGNHKGLTDMVQYLDEFRLILPDLPGYGESEPLAARHTLSNYAIWLDKFVAALSLADFIVWGHSYSGSIALIQAVQGEHKPLSLITVSLADVRRDLPNWITSWYYELGSNLPTRWQKGWFANRTIDHISIEILLRTASGTRRQTLIERNAENLVLTNPRVITEEYFSALHTHLEPYARAVTVPVLVIAGAQDVIVPLKRLRRLIGLMPYGHIEILSDQGHLAPIERPGVTAQLTKKFIAELDRL